MVDLSVAATPLYFGAMAATHEYRQMFRDIADSDTWRDRPSIVLRGPGWAFDRRAQMAGISA